MPTTDEIKAARKAANMTQTEAAESIGFKLRTWQDWEGGRRKMRDVVFELFQQKSKKRKGKAK
jgi:DNA-binding transcriptional regulator YiaG